MPLLEVSAACSQRQAVPSMTMTGLRWSWPRTTSWGSQGELGAVAGVEQVQPGRVEPQLQLLALAGPAGWSRRATTWSLPPGRRRCRRRRPAPHPGHGGFEARSLTGRRPRSSLGRFGPLRIERNAEPDHSEARRSTISRSWRLSGPLEELADAARETQALLVAPVRLRTEVRHGNSRHVSADCAERA
jgi:hypothetical protein